MNEWFRKNEKIIALVIVVLFVGGTLWWQADYWFFGGKNRGQQQQQGGDKGSAVAIVTKDSKELDKNYEIYSNDVETQYKNYADRQQQYGQEIDQVYGAVPTKAGIINQLFNIKVIRYYAEQNKLIPSEGEYNDIYKKVTDKYIAQLKENKANWDAIVKQYGNEDKIRELIMNDLKSSNYIEQSEIPDRVSAKVSAVTKEEGLKYINENFQEIKTKYEKVKAKHILVSDEATATKIKEEIIKNMIKFEDAAKKYSKDTSNATSGGELGFFTHNQMVKEFEDAAFNAKIGEVVGPVKTQFGFHLIKVEEKKVFTKAEDVFADKTAYEEIEKKLRTEKFDKWLVEYKKTEKFALKYNEKLYEMMQNITENATNAANLESKVVIPMEEGIFDKKGQLLADVKSDTLVVYEMATNQLTKVLADKIEKAMQYVSLVDTVNKDYVAMGKTALDAKIKELSDKLTKEATNETLSKEKMAYEDAKYYVDSKAEMDAENIKDKAGAEDLKKKLNAKVDEISKKRTVVLKELFTNFQNSPTVVRLYYKENPRDLKAKVANARVSIADIKKYAAYLGQENLMAYFGRQIGPINQDLRAVIDDKNADKNTKLDAVDVGISLAEAINSDELKVQYLEDQKFVDPQAKNIKDIQKQIDDLNKKITEANATPTTNEATPK